MITVAGIDYVQASEAALLLGGDITEARIRDWGRRRLATRYRVGSATWYRYEELVEVEFVTRTSRPGRRRAGSLTSVNA